MGKIKRMGIGKREGKSRTLRDDSVRGRLIVIEGTDAVGKRTQSGMLAQRLARNGEKVEIINFPTYESEFGKLIGRYLGGKLGNIDAYPPEVISLLYALDRYQHLDRISAKLEMGVCIICNRYSQSNLYQAAKVNNSKARAGFIRWLDLLESRLPQADAVVFLNLPASSSKKLLKKRGGKMDLHEKDATYQERVRALYLAQSRKRGWAIVDCSQKGKLKSKGQIAYEIYSAISARCGI
ncbi:MAG TPA: hypothetical protein VJI13_03940 [Candidatus Norongarragalinales archaeon]|nr:hypothetical protein [Candidatus Norongarragalinales archaeon]